MAVPGHRRLPVLFISHGPGPAWLADDVIPGCGRSSPASVFLQELMTKSALADRSLPPIKALCVISAHWEEPGFTVQTNPKPDLYFDYYNFPAHTYQVKWPAPGAPREAHRAQELLKGAGFSVGENSQRGLDHGVFVPLSLVFPKADIPVFQISLKADYNLSDHLRLGEAMAPLRDEGVFIITSGHTTHRSRMSQPELADHFAAWIHDVIANPDYSASERKAKLQEATSVKSFDAAHGTLDHFLPIPVACAAGGYRPGNIMFQDYVMGKLLASHFLFE